MKYELQRIEIWPVIKIVFILSLLIGFFIGLLYAGLFLMIDAFSNIAVDSGFDNASTFGLGFTIMIVVGCTFGVAFIYTVGAVIFTVFYNLLAGSIGGIRVNLVAVAKDQKEVSAVG